MFGEPVDIGGATYGFQFGAGHELWLKAKMATGRGPLWKMFRYLDRKSTEVHLAHG